MTETSKLRDNHILLRLIKPAAGALGLPWSNWRSLRSLSREPYYLEIPVNRNILQGAFKCVVCFGCTPGVYSVGFMTQVSVVGKAAAIRAE